MVYETARAARKEMEAEYEYSDFRNSCDYKPQSWEEIEELLGAGQSLHTFVGDWQYFAASRP